MKFFGVIVLLAVAASSQAELDGEFNGVKGHPFIHVTL